MGRAGFEPATSSVSGKRSPPELTARGDWHYHRPKSERRRPELNRGTRFCRPLPNHSATSPCGGPSDLVFTSTKFDRSGAEDGIRTRDLNLGKVALYQLSYFRLWADMLAHPHHS